MKRMKLMVVLALCAGPVMGQKLGYFYSIGAVNAKISGDLGGTATASKAVFSPEITAGLSIQGNAIRFMPSVSYVMVAGELDGRFVGNVGTALNLDVEGFTEKVIVGMGSSITGFQNDAGAALPTGEKFEGRQIGFRFYSGYQVQKGIVAGLRGNWMFTDLTERDGPKGRHIGIFFRFGNF